MGDRGGAGRSYGRKLGVYIQFNVVAKLFCRIISLSATEDAFPKTRERGSAEIAATLTAQRCRGQTEPGWPFACSPADWQSRLIIISTTVARSVLNLTPVSADC